MSALRKILVWLSMRIYCLADKIHHKDYGQRIDWVDELRWKIEAFAGRLFAQGWHGSEEELRAVDQDEVPIKYMSERQFGHFILSDPFRSEIVFKVLEREEENPWREL